MSSKPRITRRELVAAGAGAATLAAVPNAWAARLLDKTPRIGPGAFLDGVASGEPSSTAVTLWSRLETDRLRSGARLIVAKDQGLKQVVANTVVPTGRGINGTLKARIGGLDPREEYFYKFVSRTSESPVGRTLTAPAGGSAERLRVGFSSCQNFPFGHFVPHADALQRELDLTLFLGDYMYETDSSGPVRPDPTATTDMATYREKYRRYRSDPALRELHRLLPMAHIWDDHEVADNYNESAEDKKGTPQQRTFGYRAAFEWLPRMTMPEERFRIYRKLAYGDLLDVFLLDTRQYRPGDGNTTGPGSPLLGKAQLDWLIDGLRTSKAQWKLIAQQIVVGTIYYIGNAMQNPDAWDGHKAEREAILDAIAGPDAAKPAIPNVVWITGDVHAFIANNLPTRFNEVDYASGATPPVSTEYVGGSVTSVGIPDAPRSPRAPWNEIYDAETRGYGVLDFTRDNLNTDFRGAPAFPSPDTPVSTLYSFSQPAGANKIQTVTPRN